MKPVSVPRIVLAAASMVLFGCAGAGTPAAARREDPRVKPALKFNPNVIEQAGDISYDVFGTTPEAVRASLIENEPKYDGRRVLGSHTYWISYSYTTKATRLRCKADVKFTVRSTTTLPKWKDRERADTALRREWDVFMAALTRHEEGHRDIAIRKVDLMQRRMTALEPIACSELRMPIRQIFEGAMAEMREEQGAWDANPANRSAQFIPGARRPSPPMRLTSPPTQLAGTQWQLVALTSVPALSSELTSKQVMRFPPDTMRVSGDLGCNRFSASYQAGEEGLIRFPLLATTRMACGDAALDQQSVMFGSALIGTDRYRVSGDTLMLLRGESLLAKLLRRP